MSFALEIRKRSGIMELRHRDEAGTADIYTLVPLGGADFRAGVFRANAVRLGRALIFTIQLGQERL